MSRINLLHNVLCMLLLLLYGPTLCDVGTEGCSCDDSQVSAILCAVYTALDLLDP